MRVLARNGSLVACRPLASHSSVDMALATDADTERATGVDTRTGNLMTTVADTVLPYYGSQYTEYSISKQSSFRTA